MNADIDNGFLPPNGAPAVLYSHGGRGYWIVRSLINGWVAQGAAPTYQEASDAWASSVLEVQKILSSRASIA